MKWALGGVSPAPFFRFPALQHPPEMVTYLGTRNIAMFSCDLDSFDFKARNAQQVIDVTMKKLDKLGKGIILMHDFHKHTAEALPELLHRLKAGGYKVVKMIPKAPVQTLPQYDEELLKDVKLPTVSSRPVSSVVQTISRITFAAREMPDLRIEGYVIVSADGMLANAAGVMPDELKFEGDKQFFNAALDRADADRAWPQFLRRPAELAAAKADHRDPQDRRDRAGSVQSKSHAVESGRRLVRSGLRFRRRAFRHRRDHRRTRRIRACSWTATTRSGSRRRRGCGCRAASPAFPACPRSHRKQILAAHGLQGRRRPKFSIAPMMSA